MPIKPCGVCYTPVKVEPHKPGTSATLPRCAKHAEPKPKRRKTKAEQEAPAETVEVGDGPPAE